REVGHGTSGRAVCADHGIFCAASGDVGADPAAAAGGRAGGVAECAPSDSGRSERLPRHLALPGVGPSATVILENLPENRLQCWGEYWHITHTIFCHMWIL